MSRKLRCWIDSFMEFSENTEPPDVFRKWTAVSVVASVLMRKCWLDWGTETFYPNMFITLVGPPATRKGTAMKQGKRFLDRLGIEVAADESSRQGLIKALMDAQKTASAGPGSLPIFHSSLTVFSTELTVFLGYEDKDLLSMLCKLYDCESKYVYKTIGRGTEEISNVWVNLFGATTPGQLQAAVPEGFIGSGFTSRVVFVYAANKGKVVVKPTLSGEQKRLAESLLIDLSSIHGLAGEFTTTPEFDEAYTRWRLESEDKQIFKDPRLDYYVQRRPTHLFKLAIIYSASRRDSMEITLEDLNSAVESLHEVERGMPSVFVGIGANPLAGVTARVRGLARERGVVEIKEIAEIFSHDVSHTQLGEVLASLEQMGVIKIDVVNKRVIYCGMGGQRKEGEK